MALAASLPAVPADRDAERRPFSHRLHLKLKLDCQACHVSAARSSRLEDNNLPPKEVCLGCHKQAVIKAPSTTAIARFDHSKHIKVGDIGKVIAAAIDQGIYLSSAEGLKQKLASGHPCKGCHRGLEESDEVTKAAFPAMADCLVCHSKIQPPDSCLFCHNEGQKLKPDDHTPDYIDLHTSGKISLKKESCAVCHGKRFTCLGCH